MIDRHLQERHLFEEALKRPSEAERAAFLDESCRGSPELRARISLLLEGHLKTENFLGDRPNLSRSPHDPLVGTKIGCYHVLEKIGEGGFGIVYLAEQTEPVKRRVALKIIKLGMDTNQVVARFEAERQALAFMDHPNIARIYDAGATDVPVAAGGSPGGTPAAALPVGRPYFVMELARGAPVTAYCDENKVSLRERLVLFVQICQAVQHAHQKGIIHRDLKPSNILVTVNDGVAVPKVIDFGVAKATEQELTDKTILTQIHHFIGTPAYMSPEQTGMTGVDIDTRSDIYSLGVLLYELLTGTTPFDAGKLLASGLDEARRIIRETQPERPSARLTQCLARTHRPLLSPSFFPAAREPTKELIHQLRGDLDWIVLKCLEKDRARRYESANGLAAEIQHHLNNEPVLARPPSAAYRFQKLVRRNKLQFAAGGFALIVLLLAVVLSAWQAARANRERVIAERRLQTTVQLMKDAFESVSPVLSDLIGTTKARSDLARAALVIVEELRREPSPSPQLRQTLAEFYLQLSYVQGWLGYAGNTTGEFAKGLLSAEEAIHFLQPTSSEVMDDYRLGKLARAEMSASFATSGLLRFDEAKEHISKMREWSERLSRSTNPSSASYGRDLGTWARQLNAEALIRSGRSEEAKGQLGHSLERLRKQATPPELASRGNLWDLHSELELLGAAHLNLGQTEEALRYWRERLAVAEVQTRRWPHLMQFAGSVAEARAQLGEVLLGLGKVDEALPLLAAGLDQVNNLRRIDPENAGIVMLKARVLGFHASGYIAWAAHPSDPITERLRRLDQAKEFLKQADLRVARLESNSLQKFVNHELSQIWRELQQGEAKIRGHRASP